MSFAIPLSIWLLVAPPTVELQRARELARAGQAPEALAALARAAAGGFGGLALVESDPDLASMRALPGWAEVRAALDRNMRPCAYAAEYRQFDFWVGEWEVRSSTAPPGLPPARSRIELVEDECVIAEHYANAAGYSGRSLNVYDRDTKRWEQFWVDNKGGRHHYVGTGRDGNLYYEADGVRFGGPGAPPGKVKMTFFAQGRDQVRQLIEQSLDGGKTWAVVFDGIYTRRK